MTTGNGGDPAPQSAPSFQALAIRLRERSLPPCQLCRPLREPAGHLQTVAWTILQEHPACRCLFLPMTINHVVRALEPPLEHGDPLDELLLVQARDEGLEMLTAERRLLPAIRSSAPHVGPVGAGLPSSFPS